MWLLFAFLSAIFAGATSVLAKAGIKDIPSDLATAVRTVVVLIFAWLMVFVTGVQNQIIFIGAKSFLFLILSGCATGLSWLCYYRALQTGKVSKVTAVDKSSTFLSIILAIIIFGEKCSITTVIGIIVMIVGTALMIEKSDTESKESRSWLIYSILSAVFAALTSILGKIGVEDIDSNLATAIRTIVVLIFSWIIVFIKKQNKDIKNIKGKNLVFIILSGIATGASWLCYFRALQTGDVSVVVPVDKLSILFAALFSYIFLKEKISKRNTAAIIIITIGTLVIIL